MTHSITRSAIRNTVTLLASAAFAMIGCAATASAQAQGSTADQTGVFAGQNYGIQTRQGTNLTWFRADGTCNGIAEAPRSRRISYNCRYEARAIGNGRVSLTVRSDIDNYRTASTETLRIMPDGNLFNESAKAVAYRLRPDGIPINGGHGRR